MKVVSPEQLQTLETSNTHSNSSTGIGSWAAIAAEGTAGSLICAASSLPLKICCKLFFPKLKHLSEGISVESHDSAAGHVRPEFHGRLGVGDAMFERFRSKGSPIS